MASDEAIFTQQLRLEYRRSEDEDTVRALQAKIPELIAAKIFALVLAVGSAAYCRHQFSADGSEIKMTDEFRQKAVAVQLEPQIAQVRETVDNAALTEMFHEGQIPTGLTYPVTIQIDPAQANIAAEAMRQKAQHESRNARVESGIISGFVSLASHVGFFVCLAKELRARRQRDQIMDRYKQDPSFAQPILGGGF